MLMGTIPSLTVKIGNDKQGGVPNKKSNGEASNQMERNVDGLSFVPAELCSRQLDDLDIGLIH